MTLKVLAGIIIAVVLGILTNVVSSYIQPVSSRKGLFVSLFVSVVALSIAVTFLPDSNPFLPKPEVRIIQPHEGDNILRASDVKGTSKNLPENSHLWIYVFAPLDGESGKGKYYLDEALDRFDNGDWFLKKLVVGAEQDKDASFRLGVLLTNDKTHKQLKAMSKGLDEIPEGEKFNEISIYRR